MAHILTASIHSKIVSREGERIITRAGQGRKWGTYTRETDWFVVYRQAIYPMQYNMLEDKYIGWVRFDRRKGGNQF